MTKNANPQDDPPEDVVKRLQDAAQDEADALGWPDNEAGR